jgi:pimeloyl-ACP methyl ester carboxylesterase
MKRKKKKFDFHVLNFALLNLLSARDKFFKWQKFFPLKMSTVSQFFQTEIGTTHFKYIEAKEKSWNTVVFVHGFTASMDTFEDQIPLLMKAEINVLVYDCFSHGKSQLNNGIPFTFEILKQQLDDLLTHLDQKSFNLTLAGHSQGGIFCVNYLNLSKFPIKSLVLFTPGGVTFQWSDLVHPYHWIPRGLYFFGTVKLTQTLALYTCTAFLDTCVRLGILKSFTKGFNVIELRGEERVKYLEDVAQMLDNLSLLKDETEKYLKLAETCQKRNVNVRLVLGGQDSIVTKSAGLRLHSLLNDSIGSSYTLHIIEEGTHSVPSSYATECAKVILDSI